MGKSKELAELGGVVTQSNGTTTFNDDTLAIVTASSGGTTISNYAYATGFTYDLSNASVIHTIGTSSAAPTIIKTDNIERMRIDASGRVTMPYQPGFNVGPALSTDLGYPDQLQIFTSVKYNNGGHYSTSTGRFTVPVSGYYYVFSGGTAYSSSFNPYLTCFIKRNGSPDEQVGRSRDWTSGSGTQYVSLGLSKVAYYNINDYIELWSYDANAGAAFHPEFTWGMHLIG